MKDDADLSMQENLSKREAFRWEGVSWDVAVETRFDDLDIYI